MSEQLLIDQCSPTLAGLKTGNMFPVTIEPGQDIRDELRGLNRLLGKKGIRVVILRIMDKKALLYLYRTDSGGEGILLWQCGKLHRPADTAHGGRR